jgi:anti-anti-sigma factor
MVEAMMEMTVSETGAVTIVRFQGKLDGQSSPVAQTALKEILDTGATRLLLDLTQLSFISSAGLRALMMAAKDLRRRQGAVRACGANAVVREAFDISGVAAIIALMSTEVEALDGF